MNTEQQAEPSAEEMLRDIYKKLDMLSINVITDATLWKQSDVAEYLGLKQKTLQNNNVFTRADFPRAIIVPIQADGKPAKRWKAKEVVAWATRLRETKK